MFVFMKRLHTGLIILDAIDIACISFSLGGTLAYLYKKYRKKKRGNDPLVTELKEKSPVIMFSEDGKPLKLPLVRGGDGDRLEGLSFLSVVIKSKKLANLIRAIVTAKRMRRQLRLLQYFFLVFNTVLTDSVGLRFAVGGSLDYTQIILIAFPSTLGGLLLGLIIAYPLGSALLPLAILYGRGIEDIPDPYARCKAICKVAEEIHNNQLAMEMQKLNSLVEDASAALQLPLDKVPLLCVEEKLSLLQRYRLREGIRSEKARKRVQYFSEFIKKFSECDADPETVYQEIVGKIAE